jgi:hypothetical protein
MEFKRQQDRARDALLNMGVDIEKAYGEYQSVIDHGDKVDDLIVEYDRLKTIISNSKTPSEELETARKRLLEVEQELIDLNPDILKAEDAKSGKFREQLGLVQELNGIQRDMAQRDLEKSFIDSQTKLPQLEEEYNELTANLAKYDDAYNKARESFVQYSDFVNEQQAIVNDPSLSTEQMESQLDVLAKKIEDITGSFYGNNWANLMFDSADYQKDFDNYYASWTKAQEEIGAADQSFKAIYDTSKAYIEMNLGGSIEEMAGKFSDLSEEEKTLFDEALVKIADLNREMDLLPKQHKINVDLIYNDIRGISTPPDYMLSNSSRPASKPDSPSLPQKPFWQLDEFADGGFANQASIFGEAGMEAAIPIDNRPRSHALLDRVNEMMGHDSGSSMQVTFAPVIHVNGGGPNVKEQVNDAMSDGFAEFKRFYERLKREERRLAFK